MKSIAIDNGALDLEVDVMTVKFKQHNGDHGKSKGSGRKVLHPVVGIKTDREAVPGYRFHHVEIRKNILAPNTMLNFVPHLRDVDPNSTEEKKYNGWLVELEKLDHQSGFKIQDRYQKVARRERDEYAATLSMYLGRWLRDLSMGCDKQALIHYMASQTEPDDAITPQQKSHIRDAHPPHRGSPQVLRGAKNFTEAFDLVFNDPQKRRRATLRDILLLDKSVETIVDNKRAKDTPSSQKQGDPDLMPKIEAALASYSILGCLICFSHDCEHGDYDTDNQRGTFSIEVNGGLARTLREKWLIQVEAERNRPPNAANTMTVQHQPCKNQCYRNYDVGNRNHPVLMWTADEIQVLEQVFATIGFSRSLKAQCFVAAILGRRCWDVYGKLRDLDLKLPHIEPRTEMPKVKPVNWYDRKKKQLLGDWSDNTITHEHAMRELSEPCHHDGPCTVGNGCPCASNYSHPILCDRFCHCTAETCALKFKGCACHSSGKTCLQRQKEGKPCICVQLNRECDPVLCKGCGALERADPENARDDHLHATGCQNVPLQRGAAKQVLLGKSQLEGCGYGLFTAEDIAQDEFVIEYTGELITHDEGVRREARRGDVFNEESNSSYLFTLLEHEGIWVDAAIYGNLSRYINHASEYDRKGSNITPKILYVNGEYRIKFTGLRDIKAGEELFFNYGDNFPNLTKKLLDKDDDKQSESGDLRTAAQKRKSNAQRGGTARKTTTRTKGKDMSKARKGAANRDSGEDEPLEWPDDIADEYEEHTPRRRKKRGGKRPGAGRKKKQPPVLNAGGEGADVSRPVIEIGDSQDESLNADTPSRPRRLNRSSTNSELQFGIGSGVASLESENSGLSGVTSQTPLQSPAQPVKSKRGGARPGAGRKPKHLRPVVTKTTTNVRDGENMKDDVTAPNAKNKTPEFARIGAEDLDDMLLTRQNGSVRSRGPDHSLSGGGGGGSGSVSSGAVSRKRKAAEYESGGEDEVRMSGSSLLFRQENFQPMSDAGMDDDDDDDSVVDRSARKRQKPLRYRNDEA
ncbi:hypothetical protein B0T17DRAFT_536838 [Bombardia bombarda]|uniref:Uncharacterized protein n=1 Tax=Bombardia bombarda TaxID=252184 RepID=A0AA39WMH2_9PEZI|nr:hypothetical protein B0T17DRAFT_536838 [Bombardia bombarda]